MRHPSRRTLAITLACVAVVALAVGLPLFQPWRLFTDTVVDEPLPEAGATIPSLSTTPSSTAAPTVSGGTTTSPAPPASSTPPAATSGPATLARGSFVTHEHDTSGTASVVRLADGSRILRIESLDTSDGPDLHVWLSDAAATAGWHAFDDGRYVDLGKLKGNKGSQNYALPANLDLAGYRSVSIWCDRFNVSFGAAPLTPV
jgi:hypothetical protein